MKLHKIALRCCLAAGLSLSLVAAEHETTKNRTMESTDMVGVPDKKFIMEAAMGGMAEVQMAQLAQQKASSEDVKKYAAMLEKDHMKANEELKKVAMQKKVDLPADIGPMHQAHMTKLQALSGEQFDREYKKMMMADHKKDIRSFQKQADRGMDSDVKAFASTTLPTLQEHMNQLQQISMAKK